MKTKIVHASPVLKFAAVAIALFVVHSSGFAQASNPCPRFPAGSSITAPEDLFSESGVLTVDLTYQTTVDQNGNTLFCFTASDGSQSPTLHVNPGDQIVMNVTNGVPADSSSNAKASAAMAKMMAKMTAKTTAETMAQMPGHPGSPAAESPAPCGSGAMTAVSVNVHFHGTNTPPACHQDEVIHTLINAGETFQYDLQIPPDEPPGLYWYHPHVHGLSELAVQGGASGAIIVEGIQNVNPTVAGLPQQLLIIRDNNVPGSPDGDNVPAWDLSLNYTPIPYPDYTPAVIPMTASGKQLWRVLNASADTIIDLQLQYDGTAQPLTIIALDGVPVGSQDGAAQGSSYTQTDILIPPAGRAEFIVTGPSLSVKNATLKTLSVDTGPGGDNDPERPLAVIQLTQNATQASSRRVGEVSAVPPQPRFPDLRTVKRTAMRTLNFSEIALDPSDPEGDVVFFITVAGQTPTPFNAANPPAIVTTQGSVEDWTIENRTTENHEFHMHQIHFLQVGQNGQPVTGGQFLDTINIPYWTGTGPYPSVTVRMDFRGAVVGDFVYHCHILEHEDAGMMAIIRVEPFPARVR